MSLLNRGADEHEYPVAGKDTEVFALARRIGKGISAEVQAFRLRWAYGLIPV